MKTIFVLMCLIFVSMLGCAFGLDIKSTLPELDASSEKDSWVYAPSTPYDVPDAAWPQNQPSLGGPVNNRVR